MSVGFEAARERVLRAALRSLHADLAEEGPHKADSIMCADDELALAARELVTATDALRPEQRPVGWPR